MSAVEALAGGAHDPAALQQMAMGALHVLDGSTDGAHARVCLYAV